MKMIVKSGLGIAALSVLLAGCGGSAQNPTLGTTANVTVLETTDLHQNVMSYDYYKLATDQTVGLERTATLIAKARATYPNSFLFDDGDIIQGTVLGDYQASVNPVKCSEELGIFKVMDYLKVDGGSVGNHEFNFGLPFLAQVTGRAFNVTGMPDVGTQTLCKGPSYPMVLANVVSTKDNQPIFPPYAILSRTITASTGGNTVTVPIKIGIIGFTPPTIMSWDKMNLDGKVTTIGVVEAAKKYIPEMRAKGADLIIAISHAGPDNAAYSTTMENGNLYLAQVPGIDVLLMGHMHQIFPNASSTVAAFNITGVDKTAGTVAGVPAVMANLWGKNLGVVQLGLRFDGVKWTVDGTQTKVSTLSTQNADKSYVAVDAKVAPLVATEHAATVAYVKTPIGTSDFRLSTYFADVGDISAMQIVNQAQTQYVKDYIAANLPQYASLPVFSVTAPFKSGFAGGADFTDVSAGAVAINNAADLYLYANTIQAVKITFADLKAWLETAAQRFNQIDPKATSAQALVSAFPGYNFDVLDGDGSIKYEIDVTQALGSRIKNLTYKGVAVDPTQSIVVATNNYRASGGGNFPGLNGSKTIIASPDASRDVLIKYIKTAATIAQAKNGNDRSWRFTPVTTAGPVQFKSAPGLAALAAADGIKGVTQVQADDGSGKNLATYQIDLSQQ